MEVHKQVKIEFINSRFVQQMIQICIFNIHQVFLDLFYSFLIGKEFDKEYI